MCSSRLTHGGAASIKPGVVGVAAEWGRSVTAGVALFRLWLWLWLGGLGGLGRVGIRLSRRSSKRGAGEESRDGKDLGHMHLGGLRWNGEFLKEGWTCWRSVLTD